MTLQVFDVANYKTQIEAILKDVLTYNATGSSPTAFGYYRQTTNKPRGFYFDVWGGSFHAMQYAPSVTPNGNSGDWENNKRDVAIYLRDQMRVLDSDFFTTTEAPEEGQVGAFDAMHLGLLGLFPSTIQVGQFSPLFQVVYGRYQSLLTFGNTLNETATALTPIPSSQAAYYTIILNASFHATGGKLCVTNFTLVPIVPTNPPTISNCPMYYMLAFIKGMITNMTATPMIRTYLRSGHRQRPLAQSWEGDMLVSGEDLYGFFARRSGEVNSYNSSSVWLNPDADPDYPLTSNCIGIVITSALPSTITYPISMDAVAYGLSPTQIKVLYSRVGSTRTELTRFTDRLDYTPTIVFDGTNPPTALLEIVTL